MRAESRRSTPSREQTRKEAREFRKTISDTAEEMGTKLPRTYYAPGPGKCLTVGQYVKACNTVIKCTDEAQEFKMSFCCWWPKTAEEIRTGEIWPAIHERINARAIMTETHGKRIYNHAITR